MKSYGEQKGRETAQNGKPSAATGGAAGTEFAGKLPDLYRFLADLRKGTDLESTGTITVFAEGGYIKLCLRDRPEGRSGWVTAADFSDALRIADTQLRMGTVQWRKQGYKRTPNRRLFE